MDTATDGMIVECAEAEPEPVPEKVPFIRGYQILLMVLVAVVVLSVGLALFNAAPDMIASGR